MKLTVATASEGPGANQGFETTMNDHGRSTKTEHAKGIAGAIIFAILLTVVIGGGLVFLFFGSMFLTWML